MPILKKKRAEKSEKDILFDDRDKIGVRITGRRSMYLDDDDDEEEVGYSRKLFRGTSRRWFDYTRDNIPGLVEKVKTIMRGVILVMGTYPKPKMLWDPEKSYCDGKNIWVNTKPLADGGKTITDKIDVCTGLGVHEMCHIRYTDFEVMRGVVESKVRPVTALEKYLDNVIEDEMIERRLADEFPGYVNFVATAKEHFFTKMVANSKDPSIVSEIIHQIFHAVRYPEMLDEEKIAEFGRLRPMLWDKIMQTLQPYPKDTNEGWRATFKIVDLLKENSTEEEFQKAEKGMDKEFEAMQKEGLFSQGAADEGDVGKLKEALSKMLTAADVKTMEEYEENVVEKKEYKDDITNTDSYVTFRKVKGGNLSAYNEIAKEVKRYTATLGRLLATEAVDMSTLHKGMRSGILDSSKLAEALQRVDTVYERKTHSHTNKHAVVICIDESGSMGEDFTGGKCKWEVSREAAILVYEAVKNQPDLDLYIYGHTADNADGATSVRIYAEPGVEFHKSSLSEIYARSNNRDGVAIQAIAKRVRQFTQEHAIMIILADGQPYASGYSGDAACQHVKKTVEFLEKKRNFSVLAISIDSYYKPETMFKNFVPYTEAKDLSKSVSRVVLKQIRKNRKITTV